MLDKRALCVLGSKTDMTSVTLEEKRLKQLKQQLFGKEPSTVSYTSNPRPSAAKSTSKIESSAASLDLRSDIMKITILSLLALAIQFSLFFANLQGLIRLH